MDHLLVDDKPSTGTFEANTSIAWLFVDIALTCLIIWRNHACVVTASLSVALHHGRDDHLNTRMYELFSVCIAAAALDDIESSMNAIIDSDTALYMVKFLTLCWIFKSADELLQEVLQKRTSTKKVVQKAENCYFQAVALCIITTIILGERHHMWKNQARRRSIRGMVAWLCSQALKMMTTDREEERGVLSEGDAATNISEMRFKLHFFVCLAVVAQVYYPWSEITNGKLLSESLPFLGTLVFGVAERFFWFLWTKLTSGQ